MGIYAIILILAEMEQIPPLEKVRPEINPVLVPSRNSSLIQPPATELSQDLDGLGGHCVLRAVCN